VDKQGRRVVIHLAQETIPKKGDTLSIVLET